MIAGKNADGNWGFDFDDNAEKYEKYFALTREEHHALMEGQGRGKVITFHEDGKPTLEDPPPPTEAEVAEQKIRELKNYLSETDYIAAKIAEGVATKEEYAAVLQKRQDARAEINELEKVITEA